MAEENKGIRLKKAATELNVGISTLVEFLAKKGHQVETNPNTRLSAEQYDIVATAFQSERAVKEQADKIEITPSNSNVVVEVSNDESKEESEEVIIKNYNTSPADIKVAAKPVETAVTPDEPEVSENVAENAAEPVAPIESEQAPEDVSEPTEPHPAEPEAAPAFIPTQVGDLRIISKIDLFRKEIVDIIRSDEGESMVCEMNIQFFPLSKEKVALPPEADVEEGVDEVR